MMASWWKKTLSLKARNQTGVWSSLRSSCHFQEIQMQRNIVNPPTGMPPTKCSNYRANSIAHLQGKGRNGKGTGRLQWDWKDTSKILKLDKTMVSGDTHLDDKVIKQYKKMIIVTGRWFFCLFVFSFFFLGRRRSFWWDRACGWDFRSSHQSVPFWT